jgi:hypothetical protein
VRGEIEFPKSFDEGKMRCELRQRKRKGPWNKWWARELDGVEIASPASFLRQEAVGTTPQWNRQTT